MMNSNKQSSSQFTADFRFKYTQLQIASAYKSGLSLNQFNSLVFIEHTNSAHINELSTFLALAISSTSRLVDVLVAKGFLVKQRSHNSDLRCKKLTLTESAKKLISQTQAELESFASGNTPQIQSSDLVVAAHSDTPSA